LAVKSESALRINPSLFYTLYRPSRCDLRLYLSQKKFETAQPTAFEQVIFRLGERHEKTHLSTFPEFVNLTGKRVTRTLEEIHKGSLVIYQGELRTQFLIEDKKIEIAGVPDFIIKEGSDYFIRDCKLSRNVTEDKHPEIQRQLRLYGWLFEKITGRRPSRLEVLKGDGSIEVISFGDDALISSYLREVLGIISLTQEPYSPIGWSKCTSCGYNDFCMTKAIKSNSVDLVPDVDQNLARRLRELKVVTIEELLAGFDEVALSQLKRQWGAREQKVGRKAEGILLQARAMIEKKEIIVKRPEIPILSNYVMFDLEGLPPQLDEIEKVYLWGMQIFGDKPSAFLYSLAEMREEGDRKGWEDFLKMATQVFEEYGDIPFVHWASYEKSKMNMYIKRYGDRGGVAQRVLNNLCDLLPITKNAVVLPQPSYSLKVVEKHVGFRRSQDEYGGDWSIAKYIEAVETEDETKRQSLMDEILKYNEEDLKATWAVLEWLRTVSQIS
jgi:predicted RecB family nuclease